MFLDLEDATAPAHKEAARAKAVTALNELDWGRTVRAIRINGLDTQWCHDDIVEVVTNARENLDTIIIPKALRARDVWWVDVLLTQLEAKLGLTRQIRLEVLIEEVEGLANAEEIADGQPAAGRADLRGRRLLAVPGRAGGHQLRPARRIPRRLLGLCPQQGDRRGPHRRHRRDRRALPRLPATWRATSVTRDGPR